MDKRNDAVDNVHPTDSVCSDTPWIGFPQNWGAPISPIFSVRLDPRVDTTPAAYRHAAPARPRLAEMNQLLDEFAEWNDDILGELAR